MDAAEDLIGQSNAPRSAATHPVDRAAAGAVNARQAEDAHIAPQALPRQIRLCAGERRPVPMGAVSSTHAPSVSP